MKNDLPPTRILGKALTINCKSTLPGLSSEDQCCLNVDESSIVAHVVCTYRLHVACGSSHHWAVIIIFVFN